jgi:hypothetical protein
VRGGIEMFMSIDEDKMEQRHKRKMEKIAKKAKLYQYRNEEKKELEKFKPKREKIAVSKIVLTIALIIGAEIIAFTEFVMYKSQNFSSLYSLIGIPTAILGMMGMILGYFNKSAKENTKGGVIYEQAMHQFDASPCPMEDDSPIQTQSETFNSNAD